MKKIGIGYENYKRVMDDNCYYVDKTLLIRDVIEKGGMTTLFTRPRRFGKTLALSMLRTFFELEYDRDGNVIDKIFFVQKNYDFSLLQKLYVFRNAKNFQRISCRNYRICSCLAVNFSCQNALSELSEANACTLCTEAQPAASGLRQQFPATSDPAHDL